MLVLMCGGVSYAHGQNDGQKGMGLIMLILVGTVPTAYALNHAMGANQVVTFAAVSTQVAGVLDHYVDAKTAPQDAGPELEKFITTKQYEPGVMVALRDMVTDIRDEAVSYGTLASVPQGMHANVRNQMYLTSETLQLMAKNGGPAMSAVGRRGADELSGLSEQVDEVHSDVGEGGGSAGVGFGHDDRVEADRDDGGREDRQVAHDVCAGRVGATGGDGDDPGGGDLWVAGVDDACAELQCCRDDGGEPQRAAAGDDPEYRDGVGVYAAGGGAALGGLYWLFNCMAQ